MSKNPIPEILEVIPSEEYVIIDVELSDKIIKILVENSPDIRWDYDKLGTFLRYLADNDLIMIIKPIYRGISTFYIKKLYKETNVE